MEDDLDAFRWVDIEEIKRFDKKPREEFIETRYKVIADLQGVLIGVYFLFLTYIIPFEESIHGLPTEIARSIVLPLLLSLPWLIIYYGGLDRWAKTYKFLDLLMDKVGYFYKVFYMLNALFVYLVFAIPVLTPILSVISIIYFIYIVSKSVNRKSVKILVFSSLLVLFSAVFYLFLEEMFIIYFDFVLHRLFPATIGFWFNNIYMIYALSLMIASMSALGSFIKLVYEGAQQIDESIEVPVGRIYTLQVLYLIATAVTQFYFSIDLTFVYLAVLTLSIVEGLIRRVKGLKKRSEEDEALSGISRWAVYIIFLGIELARRYIFFNPYLQIIPIGFASVVFTIGFIYSYKKAGEIKWV